jgi:hypothetical protein
VGERYSRFVFFFYSVASILTSNSSDVKAYSWRVIQDNRAICRGNRSSYESTNLIKYLDSIIVCERLMRAFTTEERYITGRQA